MDVHVYRADGTGPVWRELIAVRPLTGGGLGLLAPRPHTGIAAGDELLLRQPDGTQTRVRVDSVLGAGTYFVLAVLD